MNILMIAPEFPPNFRGGLGKQVGELATVLSQRHHIGVVAPNLSEGSPGDFHWNTSETESALPSVGLDSLSRLNIAMTQSMSIALSSQEWDIVHAHDWVISPAVSSNLIKRNIPVLTTFHSDNAGLLGGSESDRRRRLAWEASIVHVSSIITGVSGWLSDILRTRYPNANVKHISNGIHIDNPDRTCPPRPDIFRVAYVGRLVPHKGVADLLEAWKIVLAKNPNAQLDIIGDGFQRSDLVKLSRSLGIASNVQFHGWYEPQDIKRVLTKATIAVFPSHEEAFGLAAAEAIAFGVPVLLSNIPAYGELVPANFGGFFEVGEIETIAKMIFSYKPNAHHLRMLADGIARQFSWPSVSRAYEMCYNTMQSNT